MSLGVFVQVNENSHMATRKPIGYIIQESGCWDWVGAKYNGYGHWDQPCDAGESGSRIAHRVMYERTRGPIPKGLTLDHLCRNRACVNPDHLEPVTQTENTLRGDSLAAQYGRATHCKHGHEFTEANTRYTKKGRDCRMCNAIRCRRDRQRLADTRAFLKEVDQ